MNADTRLARRRADRARQVADVLRAQIFHGAFADGLLPSESALAQEYAASRNAIRDALDLLRSEGLVERCPGVGTLVSRRKHPHGLVRLQGLAETFHGRGEVVNEIRALTVTKAPAAVVSRLRLEAGDEVVYVERLRLLDGVPLSLDLTYLAPDLGQQLLGRDLENNDIFALLEEVSGQPLAHADLTLEALNADAHTAAVLGVPMGAATLMVERLTHLEDGRPVDLEFVRFRGDRLSLHAQLLREVSA